YDVSSCPTLCMDGQCVECAPGVTRCDGDMVEVCKEDGSGWKNDQNCWEEGAGLICLAGECIDACAWSLKLNTNVGCEYWAVDLDQTEPGGDSPFAIVVSNVHESDPSQVSVYRNGVLVAEAEIAPSSLEIFNVAPNNVVGTMKTNNAFRIRATRPIVAYQFNPLENIGVFSNDASMLIPSNSLGTSYRVLGWPSSLGGFDAYVTVVATTDNTEVTLEVTAPTSQGVGSIPELAAGESWTTALNAGQVLSVETSSWGGDLSGSLVTANKPIAVFSGHQCANVPDTTACVAGACQFAPGWSCGSPLDCPILCCCDHLEEQLFPIAAWGKTYVGARSTRRGQENEHWRLVAAEDDTSVVLIPPVAVIPSLEAGEVVDFAAKGSFFLESDKPVLLGQFLAGEYAPGVDVGTCESGSCTNMVQSCSADQQCVGDAEPGDAGIGDPAFALAVPVEQLRDEYIFLVPNKYEADHLAIYAPADTSISLDGVSVDAEPWESIAEGWKVLHLPVVDGVHHLKGDQAFGVLVHGFDSFVSYAYPAGMNLGGLGVNPP
ncbi:MAG: hypothetical protein VYE15_00040, partial [Myxococcota bacterium]|nr:hypothetical protein [Myxococcota bacterium]